MGPLIAVLGAGSWGTALALQLDRSGSRSILWDRDTGNLERVRATRLNQHYLPGTFFVCMHVLPNENSGR